jgi:hypothetical protein
LFFLITKSDNGRRETENGREGSQNNGFENVKEKKIKKMENRNKKR